MDDGRPTAGRAPAQAAIDDSFDVWRERLTTTVLWCLGVAAALAYGIGAAQEMIRPSNVSILAIAGVALIAAVARRWNLKLRMAVLLLGFLGGCVAGLATMGIVPNAFVALSVGVVVAGVLLGTRAALLYTAACIASIFAVSALHRAGVLTLAPNWSQHFDIVDSAVVARLSVIFGVLSIGLTFSVRYMLERTAELLDRNARANSDLLREQAERERIQAELAAREVAYQKAAELELLGRLAGYAAHDFNNALMVIQGNAELAKLVSSDREVLEALEAIVNASRQAAATARQLRSFGPQPVHEERPISLAKATERVSRLLQALLPSNIEVGVMLQSEDAVAIEEGELQRVVTNLALNARDAMREGGRLTLRVFSPTSDELPNELRDQSAWVALEVHDSGHGMDAQTQARIFEPYFTTKGDEGTGLGLASVRELVRARGGDVTVASEVGSGTRIVTFWPRADLTNATSIPPAASVQLTGTVLVVDDESGVRAVIAKALRGAGLSVVEACDGDEALHVARAHPTGVDVLVTDATMPGMPVRQMLAQFRARFPAAGIILCSGYAPEAMAADASAFDTFLPKPFAPQTLLDAVYALIANRRSSQ